MNKTAIISLCEKNGFIPGNTFFHFGLKSKFKIYQSLEFRDNYIDYYDVVLHDNKIIWREDIGFVASVVEEKDTFTKTSENNELVKKKIFDSLKETCNKIDSLQSSNKFNHEKVSRIMSELTKTIMNTLE